MSKPTNAELRRQMRDCAQELRRLAPFLRGTIATHGGPRRSTTGTPTLSPSDFDPATPLGANDDQSRHRPDRRPGGP